MSPWTLLAVPVACALGTRPEATTEPGPAPSPPAIEEAVDTITLHPVPPLPEGTFLQLTWRATGRIDRFYEDGRWVLVDPGGRETTPPLRSRFERGRETLSADGVRRIRETLAQVGFQDLPAEVPGDLPVGQDVQLPNGQGPLAPAPYAFTTPGPHTVEVVADIRVPGTFGVLGPLVRRLDEEAWGGWMGE